MNRLLARAAARLRRALALALPLGLALPPAAALPAPAARDFEHRPEVRAFVAEMRDRHGFPEADLRRAFREARFQPSVIRAIMPPRDPGIRSWQAYRARFVEPGRVVMGQRFRRENAAALAGAAARYGVPEEVIVAIIGVETIFGRHTGGYRTFDALATLAFGYPPRAELFRRELEELLLLAREEGRDPRGYKGSYAGALGLPQFLPSSRRRHAVDFDADGRARGYALVERRENRPYVPGIGVLPDWRRRGIGEQLMRLVLGAHRDVWLHAREGNLSARRLYARLGLRETMRVPLFYSDGETAIVIEAGSRIDPYSSRAGGLAKVGGRAPVIISYSPMNTG